MKKELPKIAIDYWTNDCLKSHKKKVNNLLRINGFDVQKAKDRKCKNWIAESTYGDFRYYESIITENYKCFIMPQDLEKLKSYFKEPKTQVETVVSEIKQQYKTPAQAFDAKRLKDLEKENSKLKQANLALKECNDDLVSRIRKCGEGLG